MDDYFPVAAMAGAAGAGAATATPTAKKLAFAHPIPAEGSGKDGELWVVLLEKAFAKAFGSYQALSGGYNWFAFQMLTGSDTSYYEHDAETGNWHEDFTQYAAVPYSIRNQNTAMSSTIYSSPDGSKHSADMFKELLDADRNCYLIAASTPGVDHLTEGDGPQANARGMVDGHAYSVVQVKEVRAQGDTGKLLQLLNIRNPWGSFEWGGDWSDTSSMWAKYPRVREALHPKFDVDDGLFWMSWNDFRTKFSGIVVCRRGVGIDYDKRSEHATRCLFCHQPVLDGAFFSIGHNCDSSSSAGGAGGTGDDASAGHGHVPEGKVHGECMDEYKLSVAPKCLQCEQPITEVEGEHSGLFYGPIEYIDEKTGATKKGNLHEECWDGKGQWKKR